MDRCNFRCPYCMPAHTFHEGYRFLKSSERLSFEEITRLTRIATRMGLRKLRITGGEPLLRPNLADLIGDLSTMTGIEDIALTTNGILLAKYATELKAAGLSRITVSLDSLDREIFQSLSGGFDGVQQVLEGIDAALRAGLTPLKINAVIQRGINDNGALDLVRHFRGTGVIVRFIEYMDVGNRNNWQAERVVPSAELFERINAQWPLEPLQRDYVGEVAERYGFRDGLGEVGFISSVSQAFCGDCNRLRLSTQGALYTCLFATQGHDLRSHLRAPEYTDQATADAALSTIIRQIWEARQDRYSELRGQTSPDHFSEHKQTMLAQKIEMSYIGG